MIITDSILEELDFTGCKESRTDFDLQLFIVKDYTILVLEI